ncbi:glycosyltransferase family 2 protein [Enterococcus ureasiticus]|uniref:Glycosyltransferase 2-like domain-containing protein n=1 Tax=Enterococcus ureasiticus TaxID=903984 RepID=A0A1E5GGJ8_9ENTE|nr:glycosyltransferase family 2 protein [Enterococcus ureasiticus]OEG11761.1 hypothetical protein BCR21_05890 [Enterococcus ureasiticus]
MSEKLVSIIVPVYNLEKYIDKCVDSLVNQTYKHIEIILIDDGSSDASNSKLKQWALSDRRIAVYGQNNGGMGSARNIGLKNANGEYITFVDGDDYVSDTYVYNLYQGIQMGADISMLKRQLVDEDGIIIGRKITSSPKIELLTGKQTMEAILYQNPDTEVWGKMFPKEYFSEVKFPVGKYYEDMAIMYKLIEKSSKVSYMDSVDYFYVQHKNSIINKSFSRNKMDIVEIGEDLSTYIQTKYPDLEIAVSNRLFAAYSNVWLQIPSNNNKYIKENEILWTLIKKYRKNVILNKSKNAKARIGAAISLLGRKIFRVAFKIAN